MRNLIVGLALALTALTNVAQAVESKWDTWGVAPYASSQEEACRKLSAAIDGFSMPSAVKEHFKTTLGTTCKGGKKVWLTPDMSLEQMWSGGRKPHVMEKKKVGELPVLKAPDGRLYRKGSVAEAAAAFQWTFVYEGKTFVLYLPWVCYNWSWSFGPPTPVSPKCVELVFNAPIGGHVRWGVGTTKGPIPPDECNAQRQDDAAWTSWYGECDVCIPAIGYIRSILGNSVLIPHKYLYPVTHTKQTVRFSTEIWTNLVYICIEDAAGKQSCGVYMRPQDWQGRYRVEIPDLMWLWDDANCPR